MTDLWIDTDTASDDAVALIMALRSPAVTVRGISTVAGNVGVSQATQNALLCVELCGGDVPVFAGCDRPMLRPALDASWFHGRDGLSDVGFAPQQTSAEPTHAVDALINRSRRYPGLSVVTLGPLTNLAAALVRDPTLAGRIGRCVVMGGNPCCVGNVTPAAEYNVWCDPEAAQIVLQSGVAVELVGWHLSRGPTVLNAGEVDALLATEQPLARFVVECNRTAMRAYYTQTGEIGISLPDPTAMAIALEPSLAIEASSHVVQVECHSELTRGMTVVDQLNVSADDRNAGAWQFAGASRPLTKVVWTMDAAGFKRLLFSTVITSG